MPLLQLKTQLTNLRFGRSTDRFDPESNQYIGNYIFSGPPRPSEILGITSKYLNIRPTYKDYNTRLNPNNKYSLYDLSFSSNYKYQQFSKDRPEGGYSGLPYVKTSIPLGDSTFQGFLNLGVAGAPIFRPGSTGGLDYPIRGGQEQVSSFGSVQTSTYSGKIDRFRISKFIKDDPRGQAFLKKQVGLQLTNPKMETGMLYGILQNTRVYNLGPGSYPQNTLTQIEAMGTGLHATRHGVVPVNPVQKGYFETVNEQNIIGQGAEASGLNRLVILNTLKMTTGTGPIIDLRNFDPNRSSFNLQKVNDLGISLNRNILFQYLGGPGSTYGVGATTIQRTVDTTKLKSSAVMTYDEIKSQTINSDVNEQNKKQYYDIQDFRLKKGIMSSDEWSGYEVNTFYTYVDGYRIDKINSSYPFRFKNDIEPWTIENGKYNDLIKFVFEAVSNDNTSYSDAIFFRALLTNGLTDNNSAVLNPIRYIGRGENFYTYQGFDRSIQFSFRIAAESEKELKPMYNRLNALISQVYPDYSPSTNIMRAPLMRITVGDYLYRMPGFLENVNVTVENDATWEVNRFGYEDLAELPQVINVAVSFKPILSELPRRYGNVVNTQTNTNRFETDSSVLYSSTQTEERGVSQIIANNEKFIEQPESIVNSTQVTLNKPTSIQTPKFNFSFRQAQTERAQDAARNLELFNQADSIDIKTKQNFFGE